MAISIVATTNKTVNGLTTTTTTSPINTNGATLIVIFVSTDVLGTVTLSDSVGNTYTPITFANNTYEVFYYTNVPITNNAHTFTVTANAAFTIGVMALNNTVAISPVDTSACNNATLSSSATGISTGLSSPVANNEIIITGVMAYTALTINTPAGFTSLYNTPFVSGISYGSAMAYMVQTTATSKNPAWGFGGISTGPAGAGIIGIKGLIPNTNNSNFFAFF